MMVDCDDAVSTAAVPDEGGRRPVAAKMKQFWQLALLCWNCSIVSDRLPDCGDVSTLLAAVYCRLRCRPPAPMSPVLSDPPTAPSRPLSPSSFLSPCSSRMQSCLVCLCSAHFARLVTRNRCIQLQILPMHKMPLLPHEVV